MGSIREKKNRDRKSHDIAPLTKEIKRKVGVACSLTDFPLQKVYLTEKILLFLNSFYTLLQNVIYFLFMTYLLHYLYFWLFRLFSLFSYFVNTQEDREKKMNELTTLFIHIISLIFSERFREFIEKGVQFTRLAVQEPWGVMILQVYCSTVSESSSMAWMDSNLWVQESWGVHDSSGIL